MKKTLYFSAIASMLFVSCEKAQLNRETITSEDNSVAEVAFESLKLSFDEHASAISDTAATVDTGAGQTEACPVVTWSPGWETLEGFFSFPKTVTIDFGSGCIGRDGKERRGIVVGTYTNWPWIPNASLTIVPENYFVNDFGVEGEKEYRYLGRNQAGNHNWNVEVRDGQVTTPDGGVITWESTRKNELIGGGDDFDHRNNVYSITGDARGTNRDGRDFDAVIQQALILKAGCAYITEGVLDITPEDLKTRSIDYGTGTCDDDAVVTVGRNSYEIKLR